MTNVQEQNADLKTKGVVLHGTARYYDVLAWLFLRGREGEFRGKIVELARLKSGESVLDVGCGTGTLAIAAEKRVGPSGAVRGVDASPEMIARANKKARRSGIEVDFQTGIVEALPFPDGSFDVVLSSLMFHHLPPDVRGQCAKEIRRVLKPGGRALIVDFGVSGKKKGLMAHLHKRHGSVKIQDVVTLLREIGLDVVESGEVGIKSVNFVLAMA